jgi:hypothetical protein
MTGAEIVALITGFFKFFPEVRKLILMLQSTPEEKRQKRMEIINVIFDEGKDGRPKW